MPYHCNARIELSVITFYKIIGLPTRIVINSHRKLSTSISWGDVSHQQIVHHNKGALIEIHKIMNSAYYHDRFHRRANTWVGPRCNSTDNLFCSGMTAGFQRMMTPRDRIGHQHWRAVHNSPASGRSDRNRLDDTDRSHSADDATTAHQERGQSMSNLWRSSGGGCSPTNGRAIPTRSSSRWNHVACNETNPDTSDLISEEQLRKAVNHVRRWHYTEAGLARMRNLNPKDGGVEFTIASYNILAQCLLEDNAPQLYYGCRKEDLLWENRRQKLLDEFRRTDADVFCLQEVQCDHYDSFFAPQLLKLGYKGLYKKRTGGKNDGCAIFYRERVFGLHQSASVEYHRPLMPILDRDNVAQVAVLQSKQPGVGRVCIANTHLLFNPGRGDIRLAQMRILFAELDRMAMLTEKTSSVYHPVIVCGDMNSRPHCHLYKFISTGSLEYEGLAACDISSDYLRRKSPKRNRTCLDKELVPIELGITDRCQYHVKSSSCPKEDTTDNLFSSGQMSHGFNLISVYGHGVDSDRPEVTTHHNRASCTVDYIFYSVKNKNSHLRDDRVVHEQVDEGRLSLLATCALPNSEELLSFGGLPNAVLPSDHIQLVAKFLLKTEK